MKARSAAYLAILIASSMCLRAQTSLPISFNTTGLNSFNEDIIVGIGDSSPYFSTKVIDVFVYYESGLSAPTVMDAGLDGPVAQGLPGGSRTFLSDADNNVQFQMAPYGGNNALLFQDDSMTLGVVTPAGYQDIHFLMIAQGGNAPYHTVTITLNFSDATSAVIPDFTEVPDWTQGEGTGSGTFAISSMGLLNDGGGYDGNLHFRQYDFTLDLGDQGKLLESITIADVSNGNGPLMFFGASGTLSAIPEPSAYAAIFGALALGVIGVRRYRRQTG